MQKMNPEVKAVWLQGLRSGDYIQGTTRLHFTDGKFCCLGVLSDLAEAAGIVSRKRAKYNFAGARLDQPYYEYDGSTALLPVAVQSWAGLDDAPLVTHLGLTKGLTELNDEKELSFDEIADLIEEQL